ncbi:hypothetical protein T06_11593 [Trichinella sp. T6]|nr:hypothetical protein T06_11593 [Trichinella sp. T6]
MLNSTRAVNRTKILLEGWHNQLIKAGILQAAPTTEEEQGAVETLINQLLSRDPAANCLRLVNRTYAAKQRQVRIYTGGYNSSMRTLEQYLEALMYLKLLFVSGHVSDCCFKATSLQINRYFKLHHYL